MSNLGKNRRNDVTGSTGETPHPAVLKAREQLARGDQDGAATTLRQLLKQSDLPARVRADAAKALATAGAASDAIAAFLDVGRQALEAGDLPLARSSFASAHTLDQKGYDALFELGRVDLAEHKREQALEKFIEVVRKSNLRHLPALYEAAVLYEADGQTDQAIAAYKKIAERDRHHVPTLTRLAELYRKKGLLGDALGYYLQGARAATAAMQYDQARALIAGALQIEDDNWEARRLEAELDKVDASSRKEQPAQDKSEDRPARAAVAGAKQVSPGAGSVSQIPPPRQAAPAATNVVPPAARVSMPVRPAPSTQPQAPTSAPAGAQVKTITAGAGASQTAVRPAAPGRPGELAAQPTVVTRAVSSPSSATTQPRPAASATPPTSLAPPVTPASTGSTMDTDLPPEVTLLEKQSEVTSKLAAITAEVAEAYKKRLAIERDIKAAQAALDALNQQRNAVEASIAGLKQELETVTAAKAAEDKRLEDLRARIEASRADLEKLAALPEFLRDVEAKSSNVTALVAHATANLDAAQKRVAEAGSNAAGLEKTAQDLRSRLQAARAQAEEVAASLQAVAEEAGSTKAEAAAAAAAIAELKTMVGSLAQLKAQLDAARNELKSLHPAIEAKKAQAQAAVAALDKTQAQRDAQYQEAVSGLHQAANGAAANQAPTPAPTPKAAEAKPAVAAPAVQAKKGTASAVNIDALVVAGRLDEALRAAREAANGNADPEGAYVAAAQRLRERGNPAAAAKACEKLVGAGTAGPAARVCLALAYVDLKRYKDAMLLLDGVEDPLYAVVRENARGLCLRGMGKPDEAAQHFSAALEIPGHPDAQYREVLYNLADLYESRGDHESLNLALWSFEEIAAGAPDYRDVGDRIAALKDQLAKIEVPEPKPVVTRDGRGPRDDRF